MYFCPQPLLQWIISCYKYKNYVRCIYIKSKHYNWPPCCTSINPPLTRYPPSTRPLPARYHITRTLSCWVSKILSSDTDYKYQIITRRLPAICPLPANYPPATLQLESYHVGCQKFCHETQITNIRWSPAARPLFARYPLITRPLPYNYNPIMLGVKNFVMRHRLQISDHHLPPARYLPATR